MCASPLVSRHAHQQSYRTLASLPPISSPEASVPLSPLLPRNLLRFCHPISSPINPSVFPADKVAEKRRTDHRPSVTMMAAIMASRRAPVSKLLEKLRLYPIRSASAALRSFSTETRDLAEDTRTLDIDRRSYNSSVPRRRRRSRRRSRRRGDFLSSFFSHAFDPFDPTWSLIDQMLESSFTTERRGWDAREDENALYLRMEMPGLGKEDVRVKVEQNTLVIKGESREEEEGEGEEEETGRRRYSIRIDLPPSLYEIEDIKAEMKNGVLKVVVPKVKDEERKDVFLVPIQ